MLNTRTRCVLLAATVLLGLTGCTGTVSGTAQSRTPSPEENRLEKIMLPIEELKAIVGADNMSFTSKTAAMNNNFPKIRDEKCLGALFPAEEMDYRFTNWTAVRSQVAQDADSDHHHWVQQAALLHTSEKGAQSTLRISTKVWGNCAGSAIGVREKADDETSSRIWNIGDLVTNGDLISQTATRTGGDGWACQHALSAVATMTVEAKVCGYRIHDQAATVVNKLVANARR